MELRALSFEDRACEPTFRLPLSPSRESKRQPVEVGRDRRGFELSGHVGDIAGDVEHFLRHSPTILIVGSSRRSRGSALSGSPTSGFGSREVYFLDHPIKLSDSAERGRCLHSRSQENGPPRRAGRDDLGLAPQFAPYETPISDPK